MPLSHRRATRLSPSPPTTSKYTSTKDTARNTLTQPHVCHQQADLRVRIDHAVELPGLCIGSSVRVLPPHSCEDLNPRWVIKMARTPSMTTRYRKQWTSITNVGIQPTFQHVPRARVRQLRHRPAMVYLRVRILFILQVENASVPATCGPSAHRNRAHLLKHSTPQ